MWSINNIVLKSIPYRNDTHTPSYIGTSWCMFCLPSCAHSVDFVEVSLLYSTTTISQRGNLSSYR